MSRFLDALTATLRGSMIPPSPGAFARMDNYYDFEAGERVTHQSRYEKVLAESRFDPFRAGDIDDWLPQKAWPLLLELLGAVPDDTVHLVGAGPLEDFVRRHAAAFIEPIEAELRQNERLRSAALEMYLTRGNLPRTVEVRLAAAIGPRFWFLRD